MAKLNEGDVIEGIFALALAEIFAYGDIDKTRLNKARTKIEPEMFKDGRYDVVIRDTLGKGRGFKTNSFPPDIFTVKLILLRLFTLSPDFRCFRNTVNFNGL